MSNSVDGYKPPKGFEQVTKAPLLDIPDNDDTELWLIQWSGKQLDVTGFDGKEVKVKLHHDGQLASVESSNGKSYDFVSYKAQKPDATVFMASAEEPKVVGKISRRVCLVRYPEPGELEKPTFYNPGESIMKSGSKTKSSRSRCNDTLTSDHTVGYGSDESHQSTKKRHKEGKPLSEASTKSRSHQSGRKSQVTNPSLGSAQSHGEKSKKKKKIKVHE